MVKKSIPQLEKPLPKLDFLQGKRSACTCPGQWPRPSRTCRESRGCLLIADWQMQRYTWDPAVSLGMREPSSGCVDNCHRLERKSGLEGPTPQPKRLPQCRCPGACACAPVTGTSVRPAPWCVPGAPGSPPRPLAVRTAYQEALALRCCRCLSARGHGAPSRMGVRCAGSRAAVVTSAPHGWEQTPVTVPKSSVNKNRRRPNFQPPWSLFPPRTE